MTTKISIVFLFAISIAVLSVPSRSKVVLTNDFKITRNNGIIICDKLTCPKEALLCAITRKTEDSNNKLITTWKCKGENGKVLSLESTTEENPYKDSSVCVHVEGDGRAEPTEPVPTEPVPTEPVPTEPDKKEKATSVILEK